MTSGLHTVSEASPGIQEDFHAWKHCWSSQPDGGKKNDDLEMTVSGGVHLKIVPKSLQLDVVALFDE